MSSSTPDLRVTRFDSFADAGPAWQQFEDDADFHGVQSHAWLSHWYKKVGHRFFRELSILKVDHVEHGPLMFLPLGLKRGAAACLSWLGGDITDYHAPLLHRDFSHLTGDREFAALWNEIKSALPAHDVIHFHKQPERIGGQANPFVTLPNVGVHEVNHWSRLEGDWETFYAQTVKSRLRADSRRKRRRLAGMGRLSFEVAQEAHETRQIVQTMIRQKIDRYRATDTYSLFNDETYRDFFLDPSPELCRTGMLHVAQLKLDDRALATHWGIVFRGRFYFIMAGFAGGEWARYSPGRLLLEELFHWCFDHGVEEFDFTIGDEEFKRIWSNREAGLYRYSESSNLRGAAFLANERVKDGIRRWPALHRLVSRARNVMHRRRGDEVSGDRPADRD